MPATVELSPDQQAAHDAVMAWWRSPQGVQTKTLGGLAGTGKTTTIGAIVASLRANDRDLAIAFCAYTGKAALVLERKLEAAGVLGGDYCGTIHGLIYEPRTEKDDQGRRKMRWDRREVLPADVIVVDEASMIDEVIYKDLCSYGLPILAVGDHGQLPPITGVLNLMEKPDIRLEKIHRQAEGNPIIDVSMRARLGQGILCGDYGAVRKVARRPIDEVVKRHAADFDAADLVLCGTNNTRVALNALLRQRRGYTGGPKPGERVICLKNMRDVGLYNGLLGTLKAIEVEEGDRYAEATVEIDGGETWAGPLRLDQFGAAKTSQFYDREIALFDWAYAMTVHKSQGSQANNVVVFDECAWLDEGQQRRWKYTAYTRAAERLLIVG